MRNLIAALFLTACTVDSQPVEPVACPTAELRIVGEDGEPIATADWATLCGCPEAVPHVTQTLQCARCRRPDGTTFQAPGGCWGW